MSSQEKNYAFERAEMVAQQIEGRGIHDPAVLAAMKAVPRHIFVEESYQSYAYSDTPLPIPARQTISQPFVVALMLSLIEVRPDHRILEVGTGSGYAAALLGHMAQEVYSIERHGRLVKYANQRLQQLGYDNVHVVHGDGTLGCPEHAPFDGIVVAAGGPSVPLSLRQQLAVGGRLVMPIGRHRRRQQLVCVYRADEETYRVSEMGAVAFVPLIGQEGWDT